MDTSKYIPNSLEGLGKKGLGKAKVAISFDRLKTDRRHLLISVISILIAASSIGFGLYVSEMKSLELQRQSLRAEITLRFLDTPSRDRLAYVALVRQLDILEDDILDQLEVAAREDRPVANDSLLQADTTVSDQTINEIEDALINLTSDETQVRRQSRRDLHSYVVRCGLTACIKLLDDRLNPENLLTGESYRRALGITVAFGYFSEMEVKLFETYSDRNLLIGKFKALALTGEPALIRAAERAITNWRM